MMAVTAGHRVSDRSPATALRRGRSSTPITSTCTGLGVEFGGGVRGILPPAAFAAEWGFGAARTLHKSPSYSKATTSGRRFAFGYPACPRLEDQTGLMKLIDPSRVGISLTEQFLLEPEQSTTAIVFHHPNAKYFNVKRGGEVEFE